MDDCYLDGELILALCNTLALSNIPTTQERVTCPFDSTICVGDDDKPAISFDSGFLDLKQPFSHNLPEDDRSKLRKRDTCAILPYAKHTTVINVTVDIRQISTINGIPCCKTYIGLAVEKFCCWIQRMKIRC